MKIILIAVVFLLNDAVSDLTSIQSLNAVVNRNMYFQTRDLCVHTKGQVFAETQFNCILACQQAGYCQTITFIENNQSCSLFSDHIDEGFLIPNQDAETIFISKRNPSVKYLRAIFLPNATVQGLYNTVAGGPSTYLINSSLISMQSGTWWDDLSADKATDANLSTNFINHGSSGSTVNTGFVISPSIISSRLTGICFGSGYSYPSRGPVWITIEGSQALAQSSALMVGSSWTLLYNGTTGYTDFTSTSRFFSMQSINNNVSYASYRLLITVQNRPNTPSQYGEAQLFGYIDD